MAQGSGSQTLGAAALIGVAVIGGALILASSLNRVTQQLDRTADQLDEIRVAVAEAKDAPTANNAPAIRPAALAMNIYFSKWLAPTLKC